MCREDAEPSRDYGDSSMAATKATGPGPSSADDLRHRFAFHPAYGRKVEQHELVRGQALGFALLLDQLLPDGREKSLALTHLEETMMWANASIARN